MSLIRILNVEYKVDYGGDQEFLTDKFKRIIENHLAYLEQEGPYIGGKGSIKTENGRITWEVKDGKP